MEEGEKMQSEEMTKPVKILLLWLHITKLVTAIISQVLKYQDLERHKVLKSTLPHLTLVLPPQHLGVILKAT